MENLKEKILCFKYNEALFLENTKAIDFFFKI